MSLTSAGQEFRDRCAEAVEGLVRVDFVLSDARADLITDRIDVAIRGGVLEDSSLFARRVLGAGLHSLVASPAYIAARGAPATLDDLTAHDGPDTEVQVAGRLSGNTVQVLRKAALAGLGIALLPSTMTRRELRAGLLVPVLPQFHRKGHGVHLVYASRRHLPPAVSAFIDLVAHKLGDFDELPMNVASAPHPAVAVTCTPDGPAPG